MEINLTPSILIAQPFVDHAVFVYLALLQRFEMKLAKPLEIRRVLAECRPSQTRSEPAMFQLMPPGRQACEARTRL